MENNNKNTLNPAFYKMMDFFLDKRKVNVKRLSDRGILGFKYPEDNTNYNEWTHNQYEVWNDSLKFQYEINTLHENLPKNVGFQQFFKDIHLRVPHEKTLLIQHHTEDSQTSWCNMVSVQEIPLYKFEAQHLIKNYSGDWKELISKWISHGVEDVYMCIANTYTNADKSEWSNTDEYDPLDIQAMTGPKCFSYPQVVVLPAGLTLEQTRKFQPAQMDMHGMTATPDNSCYIDAFLSPLKSYGIKGKPFLYHGLEKEHKKFFKAQSLGKTTGMERLNTGMQMWERIFSAISHISVYSHPDFKEFCVRELKQKGLEPKQLTYSTGKPFPRDRKKPMYEHYLLDINIPTECDDHTDGEAKKKRFHLVRGHLMRTPDGGFTWRKSHWRGNRKMGVITKDYNLRVDPRVKGRTARL